MASNDKTPTFLIEELESSLNKESVRDALRIADKLPSIRVSDDGTVSTIFLTPVFESEINSEIKNKSKKKR